MKNTTYNINKVSMKFNNAYNPLFDTKKAQKRLREYVESSQQNINAKVGVIVDHFVDNLYKGKKLRSKARCIVVAMITKLRTNQYEYL